MVEASFVIGVMVVFWGLLTWTRQSYSDKLDHMAQTRVRAASFASNNCEQGEGATASAQGPLAVEGDPGAAKALPKLGGAGGADGANEKTSQGLNMASSTKTGTTIGMAQADLIRDGRVAPTPFTLRRQMSTESHLYCNEKPYDSDPVSWVKFAGRFFMTGGGVLGN